jgi:hypothetical protein
MEIETIKKGYYAIIPAFVRYDTDLTPNAKLLYGEITALCNENGYCWAKNEYFSNLYGVSETSVSNWIACLIKKGYLERELIYKEGTKEVEKRLLKVSPFSGQKNLDRCPRKLDEGGQKNFKDNNTSIIEKENIIKESPSDEDLSLWFKTTYDIYPRKTSVAKARACYCKKLKGLSRDEAKDLANKIYNTLKRHIKSWASENDGEGRDKQYLPYFPSWLNANFEDGVIIKKSRRK